MKTKVKVKICQQDYDYLDGMAQKYEATISSFITSCWRLGNIFLNIQSLFKQNIKWIVINEDVEVNFRLPSLWVEGAKAVHINLPLYHRNAIKIGVNIMKLIDFLDNLHVGKNT